MRSYHDCVIITVSSDWCRLVYFTEISQWALCERTKFNEQTRVSVTIMADALILYWSLFTTSRRDNVQKTKEFTEQYLQKYTHKNLTISRTRHVINDKSLCWDSIIFFYKFISSFYKLNTWYIIKKSKRVKQCIAVNGTPISQLRDVTCHMGSQHTVLPATRHKWTRPALTPASKPVLDLPTPEGWKAELT